MKNKKFVIAGLIFILLVGIVSVFAIGTQDKSWFGHKDWKKSGHNYKDFGDKSVWLEKLGLPSDASEEEVKEAWQKWKEENKFSLMKGHEGNEGHKGFWFHKGQGCGKS